MKKARVLIADDDLIFCELAKYILTENQFDVFSTNDSQSTIDFIDTNSCDLILLDLYFPDYQTGLNTLKSLKEKAKGIPVIIITSDNVSYLNRFSELIQNGASDIIEKPLQEKRVLLSVQNIIAFSKLANLYKSTSNELIYLIGQSSEINQVKNNINNLLNTDNHLMIFGDLGVGVENIAKTIHQNSNRSHSPFEIIDCKDLNSKDIQAAIFGDPEEDDLQKKFANLRIVQAENSTLLIANVHLIPGKLQEKFVRTLSGRKLSSLGGNSFDEINTRLIFSTKKEFFNDIHTENISTMLFNFCQDKVVIPSLDERIEDISLIVDHLISKYNQTTDSNISISDSALRMLTKHSWKENIDELKRTILQALHQANSAEISNTDIHFHDAYSVDFTPMPYKKAIKTFEKKYLEKIMEFKEWNLNDAALLLNIDRSNLFKKLQKHGIKINKV